METKLRDGWIDPNGKFHEVPDCGHNNFANDFIEKEMGEKDTINYLIDNDIYPYKYLHKKDG